MEYASELPTSVTQFLAYDTRRMIHLNQLLQIADD
jgi:hypothetical protein